MNPDPVVDPAAQGDLFMTMNISMASSVGTRTSTPNQGYEVGKDFENKISKALLILANKTDNGIFEVFATSGQIGGTGLVGDASSDAAGSDHETAGDKYGTVSPDPSHTNTYKASFTFTRQTLLEDIANGDDVESSGDDAKHPEATKKKTYHVFVVANPTDEIVTAAVNAAKASTGSPQKDLQQVFVLANNDKTYWSNDNFLMSSADDATKTIYDDEIALGTHTTKAEAYNLGTVYVQRAMSRFDLNVNPDHIAFEGAGESQVTGQSSLPNIKVTFDAVALVNMAKKANLFKVMAESKEALGSKTMAFGDERSTTYEDNWVFSPDQYSGEESNTYDFYNPLFSNVTFTGTLDKNTELKGSANAFSSLFTGSEGATWTSISTIEANLEDNAFEHETHTPSTLGGYHIWRYAMENTNPDFIENQKNGNSTGIVFRAKLENTTGSNIIPTSYEGSDNEKVGEAIYAYNNVIIGTAARLKQFATSPQNDDAKSDVYANVKTIYNAAVKDQLEKNKQAPEQGEWSLDNGGYKSTNEGDWYEQKGEDYDENGTIELVYGNLPDLDEFLVAEGFSIYRPTKVGEGGQEKPVYYCYYLYWNRHNDNNANTIMGTMEFATVRNNVYKLSVNAVKHLGHPGEKGNDPYPPKPGTPDEEDTFWLSVECLILPWEVRINNIEF